ncbi:hypothetical protein ABIE41_003890 [Bosea sp. OAE506]|uniref:hypothetical protein n=1 Tax=Bosea sp. OAE506 TaxID=2663870 RepID=UPI00178B4C3E
MADLATLRRRRREAEAAFRLAQAQPQWKRGRHAAQRAFIRATAEVIRAERNHRIAEPLLRARKRPAETTDLFSQIGA